MGRQILNSLGHIQVHHWTPLWPRYGSGCNFTCHVGLARASWKFKKWTFGFSIWARANMLAFQKHGPLVFTVGPVCACWMFRKNCLLVFHFGFTRAPWTLWITDPWFFMSGPHVGKFDKKWTIGFSCWVRATILEIQTHVVFWSCPENNCFEQYAFLCCFLLLVSQYMSTPRNSPLTFECAKTCYLECAFPYKYRCVCSTCLLRSWYKTNYHLSLSLVVGRIWRISDFQNVDSYGGKRTLSCVVLTCCGSGMAHFELDTVPMSHGSADC